MESVTKNKIEYLISIGFLFFPLSKTGKLPVVKKFNSGNSSNDIGKISQWVAAGYNLAMLTAHCSHKDWWPVVVDVDVRDGKKGLETLLQWEMEGKELPPTLTQTTASGGFHYVYKAPHPVKGRNAFASGVDIKAGGGYIVCAPSVVKEKPYVFNDAPIVDAPDWLLLELATSSEKSSAPLSSETIAEIDQGAASSRAIEVIKSHPPAIEGQGGSTITYQLACRVKDEGVGEREAFELLDEFYNEKCVPPWTLEELSKIVSNAYRYGNSPPGSKAPEVRFKDAEIEGETPKEEGNASSMSETDVWIRDFNREYAYIVSVDKVMREALPTNSLEENSFLPPHNFHMKFISDKVVIDEKEVNVSRIWIAHRNRRTYDRFIFDPSGKNPPTECYNLWRGFRYFPAKSEKHEAVERFKEHIFENACGKDDSQYQWLMSFFAHIFQKPAVKPLVAVSLFGGKGTGKSAIVNWVGHLLGPHFISTAQRRMLLGNFNSHLENLLLFGLEEAFWSGDKQAEGVLKDLITGDHQLIERKGFEPYKVANFMRIIILSNEPWSFAASSDERRLAAFEVGDGKKQNDAYFQKITDGLNAGGYRALLRFFLDFDLSKVNLKQAPQTSALLNQKEESLGIIDQWWLECLVEGRICGATGLEEWPEWIPTMTLYEYLTRSLGGKVSAYTVNQLVFAKRFMLIAGVKSKNKKYEDLVKKAYQLPPLKECRDFWDKRMGQKRKWDDE